MDYLSCKLVDKVFFFYPKSVLGKFRIGVNMINLKIAPIEAFIVTNQDADFFRVRAIDAENEGFIA